LLLPSFLPVIGAFGGGVIGAGASKVYQALKVENIETINNQEQDVEQGGRSRRRALSRGPSF